MQILKTLVAALTLAVADATAENFTTTGATTENFTTASNPLGNGVAVPYNSMRQVPVGPRYVVDLMEAMTNRGNYGATIGRPICVVEVKKVSLQMSTGVNYQFEVDGCSQTFSDTLGQCHENGCANPALWQIDVFVQPTNNTYRVERIQFLK